MQSHQSDFKSNDNLVQTHDTLPNSSILQENKHFTFKSPINSATKKTFTKPRVNNENFESQLNNPFSGPTYSNSHYYRGKMSPSPYTPIKLKEEYHSGDFTSGSRDHNNYSPFATFCKDLSLSPGAYQFPSPNTLQMRLQHNLNHEGLHNLNYSPLYEQVDSPNFPKKQVYKLEFNNNNNNKFITLKSNREDMRGDETETNVNKNIDEDKLSPTLHCDEILTPATQPKYGNHRAFYAHPLYTSQMSGNQMFLDFGNQGTINRKNYPFVKYEEAGAETGGNNLYDKEKSADLRTPSPSGYQNKKIKLDSMNSFSGKPPRLETTASGSGVVNGEFDSCNNSLLKRNYAIDQDNDDHGRNSKPKKKICCNCKKSRCLKLYCDCFGRGIPCAKECNCVECLNNEEHSKERQEAMNLILERDPDAFKPKVDKTLSPEKIEEEEDSARRKRHLRGCNCKKSGCLKRYCECYQAGVKCTELCKCENCKNMDSCSRIKRAQNFGYMNFGPHDPLSMVFSDPKSSTHQNQLYYQEENAQEHSEVENSEMYWRAISQHRMINHYQDPNIYGELSQSKRRKLDSTTAEFTPKRTLIFTKEENLDNEDKDYNEYQMQRQKRKGFVGIVSPYPQTEEKNLDRTEKKDPHNQSPSKNLSSGRRTKRVLKPFSYFNPEEYELTK